MNRLFPNVHNSGFFMELSLMMSIWKCWSFQTWKPHFREYYKTANQYSTDNEAQRKKEYLCVELLWHDRHHWDDFCNFLIDFLLFKAVSSFFFMSRLSWEDAVMIHWWEKPLVVTLFEFSLNRAHVVGGMRSTTGQASPLLMQRSAPAGPS